MWLQIPPVTQLCIQQVFIRFLIIIGERTAMIQLLKMSGLPFLIPVQGGTLFKEERFLTEYGGLITKVNHVLLICTLKHYDVR